MAFVPDCLPPCQLYCLVPTSPWRHYWSPTTAKQFSSSSWATTIYRPGVTFPPLPYLSFPMSVLCRSYWLVSFSPSLPWRIPRYIIFKDAAFQVGDFPMLCLHTASPVAPPCLSFPLAALISPFVLALSVYPLWILLPLLPPVSTAFLESLLLRNSGNRPGFLSGWSSFCDRAASMHLIRFFALMACWQLHRKKKMSSTDSFLIYWVFSL